MLGYEERNEETTLFVIIRVHLITNVRVVESYFFGIHAFVQMYSAHVLVALIRLRMDRGSSCSLHDRQAEAVPNIRRSLRLQ